MHLKDLIIRFIVGGFVVSLFSLISDLFKPKTFAGLFGAAPSVALASLVLTALKQTKGTAAIEARSMILGAVALLIYASVVSYMVLGSGFRRFGYRFHHFFYGWLQPRVCGHLY
jgi:uncharacterized membrane protein (GlpM family)